MWPACSLQIVPRQLICRVCSPWLTHAPISCRLSCSRAQEVCCKAYHCSRGAAESEAQPLSVAAAADVAALAQLTALRTLSLPDARHWAKPGEPLEDDSMDAAALLVLRALTGMPLAPCTLGAYHSPAGSAIPVSSRYARQWGSGPRLVSRWRMTSWMLQLCWHCEL